MWRRIKRAYHKWVIRNCIKDIRRLSEFHRNNRDSLSPFEIRGIEFDIHELRQDMGRARAKL